jgi:hypothetical protein
MRGGRKWLIRLKLRLSRVEDDVADSKNDLAGAKNKLDQT